MFKKYMCLILILMLALIVGVGIVFGESDVKYDETRFKVGQTYSIIYSFYEGRATVKKGDLYTGTWGYIDENGTEVIPCVYEDASDFSEGLAAVKRDGKFGFIDKNGKVVIPFIYNFAASFNEGLAAVSNENDKFGYIDKTGKIIIPFHYIQANDFSEGLAAVLGDGINSPYGRGHIDTTGKIVTDFNHDLIGMYKEGLATFQKDDKFGYINTKDEIVIPAIYVHGFDFYKGVAAVTNDENWDKWGLIDTKGNVLVPFIYDFIYSNHDEDGIYTVSKDDKVSFIDTTGKLLFPFIFDESTSFNEGLCAVAIKDKYGIYKWGYIDKMGKAVTPFTYRSASPVSNGVAIVNKSTILRFYTDSSSAKVDDKPKNLMALPNKLKVIIDGKEVKIGSYLINNTSYFKLKDVAYALRATDKRFDVSWSESDKSIYLHSGNEYINVGDEMQPINNSKLSTSSNAKLLINGIKLNLECYNIDGSNYFKLVDLGKHLMFDVAYNDSKRQIEVATTKKMSVAIGNTKVTIGDTMSNIITKLGQPDRIDDISTNLKWYVYNNDYSKFIMIGFAKDKVSTIYTSHTNFVVNETIKYGALRDDLPNFNNIKYYIDDLVGQTLSGIMIVDDPSVSLWKENAEKVDLLKTYALQEVDCLNAFRVFYGFNALKYDDVALKSASEHSKDMAEKNYFEHVGLDGRGPDKRYMDNHGQKLFLGENITVGYENGFDEFNGYLNSFTHRETMLHPEADYVGISVSNNANSFFKYYGTQVFSSDY